MSNVSRSESDAVSAPAFVSSHLQHQACEICGGREFRVVGRPKADPFIPVLLPRCYDVRVVQCLPCRFYFADPMPVFSNEALQALYSRDYYARATTGTRWWEHMRRVGNPTRRLDLLDSLAYGRIADFLEVGSGEGLAMERAIERGWRVVGQDPSRAAAEEVTRRLGLPVVTEPLEARPFPEQSFDAVYLDSVLEHVPHPRRLLEEIHRVLRQGGLAYVIVPNEESLFNGFRKVYHRCLRTGRSPQLHPLMFPYHLVGFTSFSLFKLAQAVGFRVVHREVSWGTDECRKFSRHDLRPFLIHNLFFPLYRIGERTGRGTTIEAIFEALR